MFVTKDVDAVRSAVLPSLEVFYQATESKTAALGLQIILTILFYSRRTSHSLTRWNLCADTKNQHAFPVNGSPVGASPGLSLEMFVIPSHFQM